MAAKRLGSFLSNVTGTAGQVLRVNSGETGFEMFTPATIPSYTVTNKTVDRVINADDVTLDEVADVLGTLIDDLSAMGSTGATQQVFESQEYTHTNSNTPTSYALTHNFGKAPDKIVCYVKNGGGFWSELEDIVIAAPNTYGFRVVEDATDNNTSNVNVYKTVAESGTTVIKFRAFILGQVAQINPFQWSTSEQVWPFEKDSSGNTLYCKEIDLGALPNNGTKNVEHGISGLDCSKVFRVEDLAKNSGNTSVMPIKNLTFGQTTSGFFTTGYYTIYTAGDYSPYSAIARVIYAK